MVRRSAVATASEGRSVLRRIIRALAEAVRPHSTDGSVCLHATVRCLRTEVAEPLVAMREEEKQ